jgi:amino acid permease
MVITYMLILAPAREHIENYLLALLRPSKGLATDWTQNLIRAVVVVSTAVVAVKTPYFSSVLSTVGGLTDAYQSYIIPPLIALAMPYHPPSHTSASNVTARNLFHSLILLWGIGNVLFTCYRIADRIRSY